MLLHGAPDLDQNVRKRAVLRTDVLSTKYIHRYIQNPPKPHFWGPFNAKPIIERALRKSDVIGATKLKQVLGGVKIRPLGASGGTQGPLM